MFQDQDPSASERKKDHINLALKSQVTDNQLDKRFYYEPLLGIHPTNQKEKFDFLGKKMTNPIWISSMTGGTELAYTINHRLAIACKEFGLGMGLGSCRLLLQDDEYLKDFDVRKIIGDESPLFANLGIAQIEQLMKQNQTQKITELVSKLSADGLIVHINPLQEWLQPEGDRFENPPIETIQKLVDSTKGNLKIIVKEVGQGMGKESLKVLLKLPLTAIDFAASGGTNFSIIELSRNQKHQQDAHSPLAYVGHSAEDMVGMCNNLLVELKNEVKCNEIIISGGVKNYLDGYFLTEKLNMSAIYGQASQLLKQAIISQESLHNYLSQQVKGLAVAKQFLRVR
jgi:isopentenyl-diphosphate delta-isomerase